jgi:hypothetical protein
MYIFYIDDSSEAGKHGFCAIGVPAGAWRETFAAIKTWRQAIKASDGIYMRKELHACEQDADIAECLRHGVVDALTAQIECICRLRVAGRGVPYEDQ